MVTRLRRQDGFSLIEMLAAMAIGGIILTALMTVFVNGITASARVSDRVESAARARTAMDRITTLLDSMVCTDGAGGTDVAPVLATVSDDNNAWFWGDLNGAGGTADKYRISYDPVKKTLTEYRYNNGGATLSQTRQLATDIVPARKDGVLTNPQLPIFQYFRFANNAIDPTPLSTPLSTTDAGTVVRVGVQFQALPTRTKTEEPRTAQVFGQGIVLTSNPVTNTVC